MCIFSIQTFSPFLCPVVHRGACKARGTGRGYGRHGTPQNCRFPFIIGGKRYRGCRPDRSGAYCATSVDSRRNLRRWARCNRYCRKDYGTSIRRKKVNRTCKARGKGKGYGRHGTPQNCRFPFITGGKRHRGCRPNKNGAYCATSVDSRQNLLKWARCNRYCKKDNGEKVKGKKNFFLVFNSWLVSF